MNKPVKIFLDDVRNPKDCLHYMGSRLSKISLLELYLRHTEWIIVRNYKEFVVAIDEHFGNISHVSFDHDLEPEHYSDKMYASMEEYYADIKESGYTGLDCAKYMKKKYDDSAKTFATYPLIIVHSMNPVGTKAIQDLFEFTNKS